MADAIALIDDLFFVAKVRETARHVGISLETASTGEQLLKAAEASPGALILVDLNARQGALAAVGQLCSRSAGAAVAASSPESAGASAALEESVGRGSHVLLGRGHQPATGVQGNPRRVIAFLSHVQTDLAERARAAGCQEVMPRSRFTQNLANILRGAKR